MSRELQCNFIALYFLYSFVMTGKISSFSSLNVFSKHKKNIHINLTKNLISEMKKISYQSVSSVSGSGGAGKTQLGVSVVFPLQVHALHSPPLSQSPSVSPPALIENAGLFTTVAQANTVH